MNGIEWNLLKRVRTEHFHLRLLEFVPLLGDVHTIFLDIDVSYKCILKLLERPKLHTLIINN